MKNVKKTNPTIIGILLLVGVLSYSACSKNSPATLLGPETSQQTNLNKKTANPQKNSTLLLVKGREDEENGVARVTIDQSGGVLILAAHRVEVPAGALNGSVELSLSIPLSDTLMFDLEPDGTHFNSNFLVNLVFSYDHTYSGTGSEENSLYIVVWNPATQTWDPIPSSVDTEANQVTGQTTHFSRYAISKG